MAIRLQRRVPRSGLDLPDSTHPLLQRVYRQRDLESAGDLVLGLDSLLPTESFKGMEAAVDLLVDCLQARRRILIVGDFDVDGATSCVLAMESLASFGAVDTGYIVPNRFDYGYGLTPEIVELARQREPHLIITVDNGISSIDGVQAAQQAGIRVLITDHHLPGRHLPEADAIVNPNQPGCEFPCKSTAGVGVIFYVMLALRQRLQRLDWFREQRLERPNMADLLDLVALGTVADVVALERNNRILVNEGLKRIRGGRTRPGINALLEIARRTPARLSAADLGFAVAPRLNAAGRLQDMSRGIECLLARDRATALQLASELDGINRERRRIEADMREQAFQHLGALKLDEENLPAALCLFDEGWHQGVVGIVASRVKETFHRPVIVFAVAGDAGELKGSGRSIPGFHIRDALDAVASGNPGLISRFGGHAMAAGLSLDQDQLPRFREAFEQEAARLLGEEQLQAILLSDGEVQPAWLTLETATMLRAAGPWGQGFPEPLFDGRFRFMQWRRVGERHLKMLLCPLQEEQPVIDAIAFNVDENSWPEADTGEIHMAYRMDVNDFNGVASLQLVVECILAMG